MDVAVSDGHAYLVKIDTDPGLVIFEVSACVDMIFVCDFESGDTSAWSAVVP